MCDSGKTRPLAENRAGAKFARFRLSAKALVRKRQQGAIGDSAIPVCLNHIKEGVTAFAARGGLKNDF